MLIGTEERLRHFQGRLLWLVVAVTIPCLGLVVRLFYLQVLRHDFYATLARENKVIADVLPGYRGKILDRFGRTLVDNRPSYSVYLIPDVLLGKRGNPKAALRMKETVAQLAGLLALDPAALEAQIRAARGRARFKPFLVKRDVSWEELSSAEEAALQDRGVFIRTEPLREYPYGSAAAQVLGYIQEVGPDELPGLRERFPELAYRQGTLVGKYGVEAQAERYLRGQDGYRQLIVNAYGSEVNEDVLKELGFESQDQDPVAGKDIVLALDWDLQLAAETALGGKNGAIVALDPRNGEVLAMVSHPAFDPSPFGRGIRPEEYRALLEAPGRPLYSKSIQGHYPPGSTFKSFMAVAGLEEGVISDHWRSQCNGALRFGSHTFRCWNRGGHGAVELHESLRESCDVFYYRVGNLLGIDRMAKYSNLFGFGKPTGIDLPGEKSGLIPSTEWKKRARGQEWFPGETLSCAIGQGYVLVTPLQLARATAALASGSLTRPHVLLRAMGADGVPANDLAPSVKEPLPFKPQTFQLVRDALMAVVHEPHGTGWAARIPNVHVAGKTGTAQVVHLEHTEMYKKEEDIPEQYRDHAWFTAFAPVEEPDLVVTVFVEHGGHGGGAAAPLAKQVISAHLALKEARSTSGSLDSSERVFRYAATEEAP
ncbi:MAG: penicillin-binding protein 2 [Bdellovibrionota bacterium]